MSGSTQEDLERRRANVPKFRPFEKSKVISVLKRAISIYLPSSQRIARVSVDGDKPNDLIMNHLVDGSTRDCIVAILESQIRLHHRKVR